MRAGGLPESLVSARRRAAVEPRALVVEVNRPGRISRMGPFMGGLGYGESAGLLCEEAQVGGWRGEKRQAGATETRADGGWRCALRGMRRADRLEVCR